MLGMKLIRNLKISPESVEESTEYCSLSKLGTFEAEGQGRYGSI